MVKPYNAKQWEVQAILAGKKNSIRMICKDGNDYVVPDMEFYNAEKRTYAVHNYADKEHSDKLSIAERTCPICKGDILYVRETFSPNYFYKGLADFRRNGNCNAYKADYDRDSFSKHKISEPKWHPSIHMPKEAARIWLKVTAVRVERLQNITDKQIVREGLSPYDDRCADENWRPTYYDPDSGGTPQLRQGFEILWDSTVKKSDLSTYGWNANPWVWVIDFERCEKPEPCILLEKEPAEDKRPCIGYGKSEKDDEPCEMCKGCSNCEGADYEM